MKENSAEYISGFEFEYFRTYSFQRTPAHKTIQELNELRHSGAVLTSEQNSCYSSLQSHIEKLYAERIFDDNRNLNTTAIIIREIHKSDEVCQTLINCLKTEIEEEVLWLCAPVYRDAILFYNSSNELVEGINICFECDRVESIHREHIKTDFKTFKYLKQLLLRLGHPIESPDEFYADQLIAILEQTKRRKQDK